MLEASRNNQLYTTAFRQGNVKSVFYQYARATRKAQEIGLGLNLQNLGICSIPGILEVSIGHALIADALDMGLSTTIKQYLEVLSNHK